MPISRRSDAMVHLLTTHRRRLVRYAQTIVGDHGRAEDVVQDAYLRLDRKGETGQGGATAAIAEPVPYLYLVVRNLAVDARRRLMRERRCVLVDDGLHHEAADRPTPEAEAIARDDLRLLEDALAELPERARLALRLHRIDGLRLVDIAEHLGVSVGTAHGLVADALDHCRRRLRRP